MSTPKQMLVIDIECTCWDTVAPGGPDSEIIEIGITPINMADRTMGTPESIIVLPTRSEISEYCTHLTSLTPDFVSQNGIPYRDAIDLLKIKYRPHRNMWGSWGDFDKNRFIVQSAVEYVQYPFNNAHLNIKSLFTWKYGFSAGLGKACDFLGIQFDGTAHRGVDDSYNIAKVLLELTNSAPATPQESIT